MNYLIKRRGGPYILQGMVIDEDDILFACVNPNQHGQTICTFTDKYGVTITTFYSDLFFTKHSLWEILESNEKLSYYETHQFARIEYVG